jgi:hypothetical protein
MKDTIIHGSLKSLQDTDIIFVATSVNLNEEDEGELNDPYFGYGFNPPRLMRVISWLQQFEMVHASYMEITDFLECYDSRGVF